MNAGHLSTRVAAPGHWRRHLDGMKMAQISLELVHDSKSASSDLIQAERCRQTKSNFRYKRNPNAARSLESDSKHQLLETHNQCRRSFHSKDTSASLDEERNGTNSNFRYRKSSYDVEQVCKNRNRSENQWLETPTEESIVSTVRQSYDEDIVRLTGTRKAEFDTLVDELRNVTKIGSLGQEESSRLRRESCVINMRIQDVSSASKKHSSNLEAPQSYPCKCGARRSRHLSRRNGETSRSLPLSLNDPIQTASSTSSNSLPMINSLNDTNNGKEITVVRDTRTGLEIEKRIWKMLSYEPCLIRLESQHSHLKQFSQPFLKDNRTERWVESQRNLQYSPLL